MTTVKTPKTFNGRVIDEPNLVRFLFSDVRMSVFWLIVRVWLGYQWVQASLHKVSDPAWYATGEALKGYWMNAVKIGANGKQAVAYDWYGGFLQSLINAQAYTWFGKLIAYGELLVGIGLIVGAFVGIAAFFGALMNWNFIMAGSASTNGFLLIIALFVVLAWKVAGYIGADYFLLRWLGTPWRLREEEPVTATPKPIATAGQ